jgi:two-component system, OmpR family, response regulator
MPAGGRVTHTLLIVDDSPYIRDILKTMLTRRGYTAVTAADGAECTKILDGCTPDLILLDIMMEPVTGWEILRALRDNPDTAAFPVMMITAKPLTPREAEEYGNIIEDYLVKPITHSELFGAVEGFFARRSRVEHEVINATGAGMGPDILTEYRDLSRQVIVSRRLVGLLGESLRSGYVAPGERQAAIGTIERMKQKIVRQEIRIGEIHGMFGRE